MIGIPPQLIILWLGKIQIIIYTPAVTNVLECTKVDTGVGAAIAKGSQELKGN